MLDDFSHRAIKIIQRMKELSNESYYSTVGTEYLILAMYDIKDSLCHFLFDEYDIKEQEVYDKTNEIVILRKKSGEWNHTLEDILTQAKVLAKDTKASDEHILMAVLLNPTTVAHRLLLALGLDIEDLISDVKEIYDFDKTPEYLEFVKNLTDLARKEELPVFVERDYYLNRMDVILHRKYKNNPLLIGNAGVGKTALVEGYTLKLLKTNPEYSVLALNLTSMLAGTKYRGDFEQRFNNFIKSISNKKNLIIFVDEIHTIIGAGTTDGNLDVANMLKPFLARDDIKLIGATTLDEYRKTIEKDKALSRRFQNLFIAEPSIEETKKILFGIKESYFEYHGLSIDDDVLSYLILESNRRIEKRSRPDKCIDVLDDVLAKNSLVKRDFVTIDDVDDAIRNQLGYQKNETRRANYYPFLEKYFWLYDSNLIGKGNILSILFKGTDNEASNLKDDIKELFYLTEEMLLDLDFSSYRESHMISSLIGSPPGYVGHEEEGIFSKHVYEYPISVVSIQNFKMASPNIQSFITLGFKKGKFYDASGKSISLKNTILIILDNSVEKNVGFLKTNKENNAFFDEIVIPEKSKTFFNDRYIDSLMKYNYEISFDFEIDDLIKPKVDDYLYHFVRDNSIGKYKIKMDKDKNIYFESIKG